MEASQTPRKTLPKSSYLAKEPPKTLDPDAKTIEYGYRAASAGNTQENGVRTSVKREQGFSVGGRDRKKSQDFSESDSEDGKINPLFDGVGGLEDSEINGVSSLLKMQESKGLRKLGSVLDAIEKDEKNNAKGGAADKKPGNLGGKKEMDLEEDMGGERHQFAKGDFVWGKVKSHPWWPGRVYDPVDASDYAKKIKQGDRILVAYFGDHTFAWCHPSQLKPFYENFVEMSKQNTSKNFGIAVEKAVEEVGRLLDFKITCSCAPKENFIGVGRSLAVNAGIKEGLLVPEGGVERFSAVLFEPSELLAVLKGFAQVADDTNILKFTVLKCWLSAFYSRRGYQPPSFSDPQPIPGLEDDGSNLIVCLGDASGAVEANTRGPIEEDWLSPHRGHKDGQTDQSLLSKSRGGSGDDQHQRRKQKSIAEILGGHIDAGAESKKDDEAEEECESIKLTALAETTKKRGRGRPRIVRGELNHGEQSTPGKMGGGEILNVSASSSGRKKRKGSNEAAEEDKINVEDVAKGRKELDKSAYSLGRKKVKVGAEADIEGSNNLTSKPRRKETILSTPLVPADTKVFSPETGANVVMKEVGKTPVTTGKKKKDSTVENVSGKDQKEEMKSAGSKNGAGSIKIDHDDGQEYIEQSSSPRERKRSKYLSPPYTDLKTVHRKKELEAESQKASIEIQTGDMMNKATGQFLKPSQLLQDPKVYQNEPFQEPHAGNDPQTTKHGQSIIDPKKVNVPANAVLSQVQYAACNPLNLKENNSLEVVGEFLSAFRNSISCNESSYKLHNKNQTGRKRKSQESQVDPLNLEETRADVISPDKSSQRSKIGKGEMKPNKQQAAHPPETTLPSKETDKKAPAAALFVTFGPGSSLPKKTDLVSIYQKYGDLSHEETEMFYNNYCARIVFLRSSDAEEAFNQSQLVSPFGAASVTFRLRYLSAETKTRELKEISKPNQVLPAKDVTNTTNDLSTSRSSSSDVSELGYVRQKLGMMTAMLGTADGKMPPDLKFQLQGEIKGLLEKLSTMC
ncbi:hypothetical protein K2173_019914 [Erythroxylum novogranatense]|uniref:PWWP domain-containing protein n=1 Tax=Erythroxylum novogranatense TaxID=1862640 RepID=A0AAV8U6K9_9ROSI|nr:hypothetical protein K2173_019914 [Erythroxylum novogranatense]